MMMVDQTDLPNEPPRWKWKQKQYPRAFLPFLALDVIDHFACGSGHRGSIGHPFDGTNRGTFPRNPLFIITIYNILMPQGIIIIRKNT